MKSLQLAGLLLQSGCSLFGVTRGSVGLYGSTDGTVGIAASFELGGGWIDGEIDEHARRMGESLSFYMGGAGSTHGAELEVGARVDYLRFTGPRLIRLGVREGVIERQEGDELMAIEAAVSLAWPAYWLPTEVRYAGVELRAGPAFRILDTDGDNLHWHAMRIYAGIVVDYFTIDAHRYDPIKAILDEVRRTN